MDSFAYPNVLRTSFFYLPLEIFSCKTEYGLLVVLGIAVCKYDFLLTGIALRIIFVFR